jgi:hypothetical protein
MNATTANPALPLVAKMPMPPRRPIDPVRARVIANSQYTLAEPLNRGIHLLPKAERPRRLHPGDIVYWVACLGGACLLLLSTTT